MRRRRKFGGEREVLLSRSESAASQTPMAMGPRSPSSPFTMRLGVVGGTVRNDLVCFLMLTWNASSLLDVRHQSV